MNLKREFGNDFARSAFGWIAGDRAIIGKYGSIVALDDDTLDVWFCHPDGSPLPERKLAAISQKLAHRGGLTRLNGEAYVRGRGRDFVLEVAPIAGIRRKKRMSDESRAKLAEAAQRGRMAQKPVHRTEPTSAAG